ncbi:MAG: DUF507 family protein [Desulfuromonadaceae bacterium]|nr:DUF507 family protein [Desulfuromonadaceae bacterium]MDD2854176.1 DUF507 family protein [Desulfuromonadaceae bacterium]
MSLSEDRISTMAHEILKSIWRDDLADISDDSRALRTVKQSLEAVFGSLDEIEAAVNAKLRNKAPGSRDYDVLYQKFYHDEMVRRGL